MALGITGSEGLTIKAPYTMSTFLQDSPPDIERYTPPEIVAAARDALGTIDLDPATTSLVNGTFIRAKRYYTKETNGLDRENSPWQGRTFINPPGGGPGGNRGGNGPRTFWERLIVEYTSKNVTAAVFLAYDIEFLQQSQSWNHMMLQWPFCIPEKRLVFWREKNGRIEARDHSEFSNAIIYVGKSIKRFSEAFKTIGAVIIPRIANPRPNGLTTWNGNPMTTGLTEPPIEGSDDSGLNPAYDVYQNPPGDDL